MSDCDTDELMLEAGAAPPAQDRHDKELGTQECWCAVPAEEDAVKEVRQDVVEKEPMEPEDEEALVDHIRWVAVQPGKDGMDGIALGEDPVRAKCLSDAFGHRITMNELQGKAVGGVASVYFNAQLYSVRFAKKYRFVY